jgi:chromosomal replication initiator protein
MTIQVTYYTCAEHLRRLGFPIDPSEPQRKRILIRDIQHAVAARFQIPVEEMWSARRSREIVRPRQAAMYLARQLTPKSLPEIGRLFGGRDHTTVVHGLRAVERRLAADDDFASRLLEARRMVVTPGWPTD